MTNHDGAGAGVSTGAGGALSRRSIVMSGAAAALAAASIGTAAAPASAAPTSRGGDQLRVGAGRAAIPIPAATYPAEQYDDVHDPLYVRLVLVKTDTRSLVLIVLDLTSISEEAITDIRTAVTKVTGVAAAAVVVTVTHNFSSPHVGPSTQSAATATWISNIVTAARTAAATAVRGLKRARVGFGTGRCDVNVNRNLLTKDGYYLGANDEGPSDKTVEVARFDDTSGNPIAILTNFSVQSSVVMESATSGSSTYPYEVSADLAGAASTWVESQYSGVVAPFLVGATGDQQPAFRSLETLIDKNLVTSTQDAGAAGWSLLKVQGQRLGIEIVRVARGIETRSTSDLELLVESITLPTVATTMGQQAQPTKSHTWTVDGTQPLQIWVFRIGGAVFAGTPPELSTPTLEAIRTHSPFRHTFVMSMFEGGAKNMPDKWNYDHFTYEALDGNWAPGDAEKYVTAVGRYIRSLH